VDATRAPKRSHQLRVDDPELKPKAVSHLLLPLDLEAGGTHDEHAVGAVPLQQFEHDEAGLDGLAKTDIVCNQEVRPRHVNRSYDRVELVVVDLDAAPERGLHILVIRSGHGCPSNGIQKSVEVFRFVEAGGLGQR